MIELLILGKLVDINDEQQDYESYEVSSHLFFRFAMTALLWPIGLFFLLRRMEGVKTWAAVVLPLGIAVAALFIVPLLYVILSLAAGSIRTWFDFENIEEL